MDNKLKDKKICAKENFESGCNCSQAVFCAFTEETGFSREEALKLSAGFGGGFSRLREVCGAVSGMTMVLSYLNASTDPSNQQEKKALYELVQKAAGEFRERHGSIVCRELLSLDKNENNSPDPTPRTKEFYQKRPCSKYIQSAAEICEDLLKNK